MNLKSAGKVFTVAAVFFAATANAENVEITLIDMLDGITSSYFLDIKIQPVLSSKARDLSFYLSGSSIRILSGDRSLD